MRIGIYGGTFNPIHNTHIEIAQAAKKQFDLDIVYFLISGTPPHKNTSETVADLCRYDMVRLAIQDIDGFEIDDREIYRAGKSYSYITFTELHEEHPDDDLFFIMGSDSLINFKNWVKPEIISEYASILTAPRAGDDISKIEQAINECKNIFDGDFFLIDYINNFNDLFLSKLNNVENHPVSIMHGDSINYKGLQIADLISWSVFQKAEHQNAKYIDLMENKKIFGIYKN